MPTNSNTKQHSCVYVSKNTSHWSIETISEIVSASTGRINQAAEKLTFQPQLSQN